MRYNLMGRTGVRVSEICLGTMTFGKESTEEVSRSIMDRAVDLGINFFDTANIYNAGLTEEIVGRWLKERREEIVLASKVHFPMGQGQNDRGCSRRHIVLAVEKILQRLQTDWLDLLYLHHWDSNTAIEESLSALDHLVAQGKVLYPAVSNFAAWQTEKALWTCDRLHLAPIVATQPQYNLLKRQAEVEILPMAQAEGLAVIPYSPLAAGMLTGKYARGETGRIDENKMYTRRFADDSYPAITQRFVDYAQKAGHAPAPLAVAWVNAHPAVTSSIVGARSVAQFDDTMRCLDIELSEAEWNEISSLSYAPPLATDRED